MNLTYSGGAKEAPNQALSNLLAQFFSGELDPILKDLPSEEECKIEDLGWHLVFDGSYAKTMELALLVCSL